MPTPLNLAATAALAAILLSGCGRGPQTQRDATESPLPDPPLVSEAEPGTHGGRLVIAAFGDPKTFNPITSNESSSTDIIRFLFSSLVGMDTPTQKVLPGLAESWSVEADQKTWTFKLRSGLQWSDGHPLTVDDVLFTWEVIYNPNIVNVVSDLFRIDGRDFAVSRVDEQTIRVVTPDVYAPFLEYFGSVPIIPRHILAPAVAAGRFEAAYGINTPPSELVGSGPFVLKDFRPGQSTLLERNPRYFVVDSKGQRLPYLDTVIYTVVPDMNAMTLRFLQRQSDAHERVRPDEFERFKALADRGQFQLLDLGMELEKQFLWFNQNTNVNPATGRPFVDPAKLKWFRNAKFRQAISHAIDRESITRSVYAGLAKPSYGFVSPANERWYNPDVPTFPHNLERARALLREIGIHDRNGDGFLQDETGATIEFILNTNAGNNLRENSAVLIRDDLRRLGIRLVYQPLEFNSLVDRINNSFDYDCILLGLGGGGLDPASNMNVLLSSGFTHQWFPLQKTPSTEWEARIDWLMNAQLKTLDHAERKKLFDEVQHILAEQQPMIFTVVPNAYAAVRNDLGNVRPTALSTYRVTWNAEELYFKK